jgi:hypothetical protein
MKKQKKTHVDRGCWGLQQLLHHETLARTSGQSEEQNKKFASQA